MTISTMRKIVRMKKTMKKVTPTLVKIIEYFCVMATGAGIAMMIELGVQPVGMAISVLGAALSVGYHYIGKIMK